MDSLKVKVFYLLAISMAMGGCSAYRLNLSNCKDKQCEDDHYEVSLSLKEVSNFSQVKCYINRNEQIRYYACLRCSHCKHVILECSRKHDTICFKNCTIPDAYYDTATKKCITKEPHDTNNTQQAGVSPTSAESSGDRGSWKHILLIVGSLNVNLFILISMSWMFTRKWKRWNSGLRNSAYGTIPRQISTVRNTATLNVISENDSNKNNRNIDVTLNCDMSIGENLTQMLTTITPVTMSSNNLFWLEMKANFGPEGGTLSDIRSGVSLIIPANAISETHQNQEIIVRVSLKPSLFGLRQENNRYILSPVVECLSPGLPVFNTAVTLVVPHRAKLDPEWKYLVLHSEDKYAGSSSKFNWNITSCKKNETPHVNNVHFDVDESYFRIKTTHFTTYVCTGCSRKAAKLNLQVVVYGNYSHLNGKRQRVDLRCYVTDPIKDYTQKLREYERKDALCMPVTINSLIDKKTKSITIKLPEDDFKPNWPWTLDTFNDSLTNEQVINLQDVVRCCSEAMPSYKTFVFKPKCEETKLDILEVTLKIVSNNNDSPEIIGPIRVMTMENTQNRSFGQTSSDIITTEKLGQLARTIPVDSWKNLYRRLHILSKFDGSPEIEIEKIQYDYQGNVEEMKYQCVVRWQKKAGSLATTCSFIQALKDCELNNIVFAHFRTETDI